MNDSEGTTGGNSSQFTHEDVFDTDGKKWYEKFHGLRGRFQQVERQHNSQISELEGKISKLEDTISDLRSQLEDATGKASKLDTVTETANEHLTRIRELEQQLEEKDQLVSKQKLLTKYPQLLGNKGVVKLVEAASMTEKELEATLSAMAEQAGSNKVVAMAVPQPGEEVKPETTLEKLHEQEREIRKQMNEGNRSLELDKKHREVWFRIKELESQVS